ncbi:MAG TPA: nucleoside monophosphate kinase [Candidatus Paceibacterota bacterium]|nr:nucleoside monophosphate kinase [Candidatus Paceibacterota bacterium]
MTAPLILFLGKPGSGKGTQAALFSEKTGFSVFKTSGELRELAKTHPHIGEKIRFAMDRGELVPYWLPMHLWLRGILSLSDDEGIVIDGAVRRIEEAVLFDEVAAWFGRSYRVFFLTVSDEEMQRRIEKRATAEGRTDDNDEALRERLQEYERHTARALDFFKSQDTYVEIDGEGSVEEIHERVMGAFKSEFPEE